jgi:hypothetical protein
MADRFAARTFCTVVGLLLATSAFAQEADQADASAELAKKLQNPIASLISVPFQNNFEFGAGRGDEGFKWTLNVQPVIPISLTPEWNLISRTIVPIIHQDDVVADGSQTGMGDILESLFFSPLAPGPGGIVWGAGPVFLLPTSTEEFLGAEKFAAGPTAVVLRQQSGWTYGALVNHLWDTGGGNWGEVVNATFLQPFVSYTTKTYTTIGINTESTYDWENSKWTVPINPFITQLVKIGGRPVSFQLGYKQYVERPTPAPDWGVRFTVTLLFPR